ncbi:peptidoglycan/LPS O-acetylase OafA/YrhL [Rhizobium skierniewicense]|uniref:Peptidoglycan/LPS O-acetylase OafA/YrhL n=1 Tax=Rhizobium skierniewicense TaxID=984260 RepID=A0A7W6CD40_9HYPH|nr:acyltransferase family protein [Rhizobium skierniewicense]MBB3948208.1 peptidoglycan/LPS O-acetylase OafA/YrhL [Rhizobium skierniewicense]
MTYRPEIDGLRAIAVLGVIFAHANFAIFSGGFMGVDVFFVISGYLITTVILDARANGTFSLRAFYERRARRIVPALFFVLLCTLPPAWMWLLPDAYEAFSKSLMTATLSVSNVYFLRKTDYFAPDAAEVPLLHTWSLGVEEQFYLLFPLLFLLPLKTKTIFRIVVVAAIASLIASEIGARFYPSANYYLLPTRAWEILVGALCAFYVNGRPRPVNGALAFAGVAMVLAAIFLFDPATLVPSLMALLPVAGACGVLVFASRDTWAGRILSLPPLVWIGRISFSTYLWHQPVFVFWRIRSTDAPSNWVMGGLILLTAALAAFTWRFVEQPFRSKRIGLRRFVGVAAACGVVLMSVGFWGDVKDGLPFRLSPDVQSFAQKTVWSDTCLWQVEDGTALVPDPKCLFNAQAGRTYALWGDSIAASMAPSLANALKGRNIGLVQITHGFCAPIIGVSMAREEGAVPCDDVNARALAYLNETRIDTVILTASWVSFLNTSHMRIEGRERLVDTTSLGEMANKLRETIEALRASGKRVVVIYPSPRFDKPVIDVMAARIIKGDKAPDFPFSASNFQANTARAHALLDAAVPDNVGKVLPETIFCNTQARDRCLYGRAGVAYIADRGHYTAAGAAMVVESVLRELDRAQTTTSN